MKVSRVLTCLAAGLLLGIQAPHASASLGIGTRALGMGGAYTAVADDATAAYYNPAGLAKVKSFQFQAPNAQVKIDSNLKWQDVMNHPPTNSDDRMALLEKLKSGTSEVDVSADMGFATTGFALSIIPDARATLDARNLDLNFNDYAPQIDSVRPLAAGRTSSSATITGTAGVAVGVSLARTLRNGDGVGVTVKSFTGKVYQEALTYVPNYDTQSLDETSTKTKDGNENGVGVDLGYMHAFSPNTNVGVMLRNIVKPNITSPSGDREVNLGVAHRFPKANILLAADLENTFNHPNINLGAEFKAGKFLSLWTGVYERKATLGLGLNILGLKAQVAYSPENISMMSGSVSF